MKKSLFVIISAALLSTVVLLMTSCIEVIDFINSLSAVSESDLYSESAVTGSVSQPDNTIPFSYAPEILPYELPSEQFDDPVEKEAAEIIDDAIAKAISYVNSMKDERHSTECVPFENDANGYISKLDGDEKQFYDLIVNAGKLGEHITVYEDDYPGDLKKLYFDLYEPLTYCEPGLSSYFMLDVDVYIIAEDMSTRYSSLFDWYFDPDHDANAKLSSGDVTIEKIMHDAELLERVVNRIVRFMPEGLSAYDRYYYLAAVLSEQVSYDDRPENCFSAYGALIGGRAVCEGYTCAYYLLCREAGLWCAYRDGLPHGQGHTWNMVKLDSGIYNVDVTWCDGYGKPYEKGWYDCFIKSDSAFEYDGHCATYGVEGTGDFEPCPYEENIQ